MCGRFAFFQPADDVATLFDVDQVDPSAAELGPNWNVAPTQRIRLVVERPGAPTPTRSLQVARWGLVPPWAKDKAIGVRMINARSETLAEKRSFVRPLAERRGIIPADGYYEWRKTTNAAGTHEKQPYWIYRPGETLGFAGLFEFWRDPALPNDDLARWLVTATIITTAASGDATPENGGEGPGEMAQIHDRMPVVLPRETWDRWLDPSVGAPEAQGLLATPTTGFTIRLIGPEVGSVRNNRPELLNNIDEPI